MEVAVYSNRCISHEDLTTLGFIASEDNTVYERLSLDRHSGQEINFKMWINPEIHPELGTNIEVYVNGRMTLSGYWHDKKDFDKEFSL